MNNNFWIKVYLNNLDDPDICTLSDRLYRRLIELTLYAGRLDSRADDTPNRGLLPETKKIAFVLRMTPADLEPDLVELEQIGFISRHKDGWLLPNYAEEQAPISAKERNIAKRKRDKEDADKLKDATDTSRNDNDTSRNDNGDKTLRECYATDTENQRDTETETYPNRETYQNQDTKAATATGDDGDDASSFLQAVEVLQTAYNRTGQTLHVNKVIQDNAELVIRWSKTTSELPPKVPMLVAMIKNHTEPPTAKKQAAKYIDPQDPRNWEKLGFPSYEKEKNAQAIHDAIERKTSSPEEDAQDTGNATDEEQLSADMQAAIMDSVTDVVPRVAQDNTPKKHKTVYAGGGFYT